VVRIDGNGNVDVAGSSTYFCDKYYCYADFLLIQYDANGNQLWKAENLQESDNSVQVEGLTVDTANNLYAVANSPHGGYEPCVLKYASNGSLIWTANNPDEYVGNDAVHDLTLDNNGNVLLTGQFAYLGPSNAYGTLAYGTYKANTNGSWVWTNFFPIGPLPPSSSEAIAADQGNNVYVTGYSPETNGANDIVTIKYDPNGHQIWLQRYTSPGNGNAAGNAIAVDNNGNVYVTGYETTSAGGTEIVTIKYSPITVQRRSDGTVLLQAQGSPGESFDIQASADLQSWLDLGIFTADTNGLLQFADTNAPNFTSRFYFTHPQ
jgi:hypothetical protein